MEEVGIPLVTSTPVTDGGMSTPTSIPVIPVVGTPEVDFSDQEGYSLLQKSLFLAAILGCVAIYLKMNNKKGRRYQEKSMA